MVTRGSRALLKRQLNDSPGVATIVTVGRTTVPTATPSPLTQAMLVSTQPVGGVFSLTVTVRDGLLTSNGTTNAAAPVPEVVVMAGAGSLGLPEPVVVKPKVLSPPTVVLMIATSASRTLTYVQV